MRDLRRFVVALVAAGIGASGCLPELREFPPESTGLRCGDGFVALAASGGEQCDPGEGGAVGCSRADADEVGVDQGVGAVDRALVAALGEPRGVQRHRHEQRRRAAQAPRDGAQQLAWQVTYQRFGNDLRDTRQPYPLEGGEEEPVAAAVVSLPMVAPR